MQKEEARNFSPSNSYLLALLESAMNRLKLLTRNDKTIVPPNPVFPVFLGIAKKFIAKSASNSDFPPFRLLNFQRETASQTKRHMIAVGARKLFGLTIFARPKSRFYRIIPKMKENAIFFLGSHAGLARKTSKNLRGCYPTIQSWVRTLDKPTILPSLVSFHHPPLSRGSVTKYTLTSDYSI